MLAISSFYCQTLRGTVIINNFFENFSIEKHDYKSGDSMENIVYFILRIKLLFYFDILF